ncbi:SAM-dependent chlorinase/fluorinase [Candidatus Oleimmundimicrobium sp.]|uniref:SAM hydrolase/SAM-dependent halogenase family protein n=1 Tax=Candidatus Oleimmundimicrobium sp. TaxID=3060597 RepID=UPI0027257044|nr:SAM-dependent chlorinase/fluorinase [Candidatus Oleimmundimicrobium sp.]MDO8885899.1 SAM-dependent chlorinase/fluorinase [Candidatus Oleimmundimicrobium sp.]
MKVFITMTSDFGFEDGWVGVCKGVILNIAPNVQIIDISHNIPSFSIKKASFILSSSLSFMPLGIHLAIVDPGVGTLRRPIVLQVERGDYLVGPDNGLLIPVAEKLGGITKAIEIKNDGHMSKFICSTFQARDIFAPVAGYLANDVKLDDIGVEIPKDSLVSALWKEAAVSKKGKIECEVIDIDKFGTVHLNLSGDKLSKMNIPYGKDAEVSWERGSVKLPFCHTFGDVVVGDPLALVDSTNYLSIAVNQGNAARFFNLKDGDKVAIKIF